MSYNVRAPVNDAHKLLEIVLERDRLLSEKEARISCVKNVYNKGIQEIRDSKWKIKQLASELEHFPSIEPLQYINKSIINATLLKHKSVLDYQAMKHCLKEKIEQQEKEVEKTKQEYETVYFDAIEKIRQTPQYQELETVKLKWLKLDIEKRDREEKAKLRKKIYEEKKEIADRMYNVQFVELADYCLVMQGIQKLTEIKRIQKEAIRELYDVQERVKVKQQTPAYHSEKLGKLSKITLGNGKVPSESGPSNPEVKVAEKSALPQMKVFQELGSMFVEPLSQEPTRTLKPLKKENVLPSKIRVLDSKLLVPSFNMELSTPQQKRKKRAVMDVASQYRKISEKLEKKLNRSVDQLSQQSQSNSQLTASQQSHQSEKMTQLENSQPETQGLQGSLQGQTQLSTILIEDTQMTDTQAANEVIEDENNDYIRESQIVSIEGVEEMMPSPTPRLQSIMKNSQNSQTKTSQNLYTQTPQSGKIHPLNSSFSKKPNAPLTSFAEPQKSVRFNLDSEHIEKERNTGMFGDAFGFGKSTFSPFFGGGKEKTLDKDTSLNDTMHNTMNNTIMDLNNSRITGENPSMSVQSPEFSYEDEPATAENKQDTNVGGFMSGFGGGFSFGKNMFNF